MDSSVGWMSLNLKNVWNRWEVQDRPFVRLNVDSRVKCTCFENWSRTEFLTRDSTIINFRRCRCSLWIYPSRVSFFLFFFCCSTDERRAISSLGYVSSGSCGQRAAKLGHPAFEPRVIQSANISVAARYHFLGNVFQQSPLTEWHATTRVSAWPGDPRNCVAGVTGYPARPLPSTNLRSLCPLTSFPLLFFHLPSVYPESCHHSSSPLCTKTGHREERQNFVSKFSDRQASSREIC